MTAANFAAFLENKDCRTFAERTKDYNRFFFKIPYDDDCDFIHVIRIYTSRYNADGRQDDPERHHGVCMGRR